MSELGQPAPPYTRSESVGGTAPPAGAVACSRLSEEMAEPLAGTAAAAVTWLCIEQTGPYGPDAVRESHLDHAVGNELARRAASTAVRIQLIRRPGRHADDHHPGEPHDIFIAHTRPGATWLEHARIDDPARLLELDFEAIAAGVQPGFGRRDDQPRLLVCTNGRRDVCCAIYGRPVAAALAASYGETVWETTHTGGHRFAPTAVLLPTGYLYGRLDTAFAGRLFDEAGAGRVESDRCRGRSTWSPAGQVAELAVRERAGGTALGPDDLSIDAEEHSDNGEWEIRVAARTGQTWMVRGREEILAPERRTSCAKAPVSPSANLVSGVSEVVTAGLSS